MSILSPTDRAVLWRTPSRAAPTSVPRCLGSLPQRSLRASAGELDLYSGFEDQVIETVELLDRSGLLGRDDLREAFEEADEDGYRAQTFAALLISHLNAAADVERLGIDARLKALRLAGFGGVEHIEVRPARGQSSEVLADSSAGRGPRYGVTPQAVYKWIAAGRVNAEQTPGGSWRLPAGQFAHREGTPDGAVRLKAELLERIGEAPSPSDEELAGEVVKRRRS